MTASLESIVVESVGVEDRRDASVSRDIRLIGGGEVIFVLAEKRRSLCQGLRLEDCQTQLVYVETLLRID